MYRQENPPRRGVIQVTKYHLAPSIVSGWAVRDTGMWLARSQIISSAPVAWPLVILCRENHRS